MIQKIQEYRPEYTAKQSQFVVKFERPQTLQNPMPIFYNALYDLRDKIGQSELQNNLETFCYGWALESGYSLEIDRARKIYNFKHVSLLN